MKFSVAIDCFVDDQYACGRFTSPRTEVAYRSVLYQHADDVSNRDPACTGREDVKLTLRRWPHPSTQTKCRAILVSFYEWTVEEAMRPYNPARQTRRPRRQPPKVYRLTKGEAARLLTAAATTRERRIITLGLVAGLRNQELRGLRGRHLSTRDGFVHVSADIAKGSRERWIPVLADLEPVVADICSTVADAAFVIPGRRPLDPGVNSKWREYPDRPASPQAIWTSVGDIAVRAGIKVHIHPHLLRHAFGDHVARYAGSRAAQHMLGHQSIATTEIYTGQVSLDELVTATRGLSYFDDRTIRRVV